MVKKFTGSDTGKSGLRVQEDDGVPNVYGVTDISVSDTTLTDDGGGKVSIATGGGGAGTTGPQGVTGPAGSTGPAGGAALTVEEVSGPVSVANVDTIRVDDTSGLDLTDDGGGQVTMSIGSHWYTIGVTGQTYPRKTDYYLKSR